MAAEVKILPPLFFAIVFFTFEQSVQADIPRKCNVSVGEESYLITNWTWRVVNNKNMYYINICGQVNNKACDGYAVCKSTVDDQNKQVEKLGSMASKMYNETEDGTGFTVKYQGDICSHGSSSKWSTRIILLCGKFLGAPEYVEESVSDKGCEIVFEFVTNEACKKKPKEVEIPCSTYNSNHELVDLSPLIKLQGGFEVAAENSQYDFHINVCRGITKETTGDTRGCPGNSSMCRFDRNRNKWDDVGSITLASGLTLLSSNKIALWYNTSKTVDGCPAGNPVTKITFVCPQKFHQLGGRGPQLTAEKDCHYEVLWETEYACPQSNLLSTNSCVLSNEFVNFDLSKLMLESGNYMVNNISGKLSKYAYYINVCKTLGFDCGENKTAVCQEEKDGKNKWSLGVVTSQKLQYADGELILTYQGGTPCSSGLRRSTVITFKCDYHSEIGEPEFSYEDYCLYFFDWRTKYACPPSRRTGTHCRVESSNGKRYDLSELVRLDGAKNWLALDGESSTSDKQIYINVCGRLNSDADTAKCERAAAVCMISKSTGIATSLGRYTDPPTLNPDRSIKLEYTNGKECRKDAHEQSVFTTSTITFVCQPGDLESAPVLVSHSHDHCHYEFMWKSAAACSLGVTIGKDCKVEDKEAGYVFDLGPLASKVWNKTRDFYTIPNNGYDFQLKVCGGSNKTNCNGSNIGACQYSRADRKSWKIGEQNSLLYYYDGMINLTYPNGDECRSHVKRTSHITFLCDPNAAEGVPQYEKENSCVYNFMWFTKYACPAKVTECVAKSDGDQYDLTSLVKTQDNWKDGSRSSTLGIFYINVCRALNLAPDVSDCSGTAAVCWKKPDGSAVNLGEVSEGPVVQTKGSVVINYTNGDTCHDNQRYTTVITFNCNDGETASRPQYDGTEDNGCTYKFRWESAAACTIKNVEGKGICAVKDPKSDTLFNLLPLMKKPGEMPYNISGGKGGIIQLNICGTVSGCNTEDKAGACLIVSGSKKILLGKMSKTLGYKGEILTLSYMNGYNYVVPGSGNGRTREAHIKFYCNPKVPFGKPAFAVQEDQKFFFDFQTSLACPASAVQCLLTVDQKTYDLSRLGLTSGNWEAVDSRSENKHLHYYINVCRPVNPTVNQIRCPGGPIGACQVDHKSSKAFNLGYIQSDPSVSSFGELTLQYLGGSGCHGQFNRSTRIIFSCSKIMGSPVFVSETPECEYVFSWETPSACPLTKEYGTDCKVEDKQYYYMFDLSNLYNDNEDYNVSVRGAPGERILLNVCKKLKNLKLCPGSNTGACILKDKKISVDVNSTLSYYNGQINLTYAGGTPRSEVNIIFECLNTTTNSVPTCEKISDTRYECHWLTPYACMPLHHVQCSIRTDDGSIDEQYDFSPLSTSARNWQARNTGPLKDDAMYFISVCRSVELTDEAAGCSPTAGVCMRTNDSYVNLGSVTSGPVKRGTSIFLKYENGDKCKNGKRYSTMIQMECGSIEGDPVFVTMSEQTCVYDFLWITSTACPVNTKNETVFDNCTAINPQTRVVFDLKKLRNDTGNYVVHDKYGRSYFLNVCGPVNNKSECSDSTGVCQVQTGSKAYNAGINNKRLHYDSGILYLNYSGGDECHHVKKRRETIITFVCNYTHGGSDYGKPVFITETDDCTYHIRWHTSLVCERQFECTAFIKRKNSINIKYNLAQLMKTNVNWVVLSLADKKTSTYYINLCRPLVPIPNVLCHARSWACRVEYNGEVQDLGRATAPLVVDDSGTLHLKYKSKIYCNGTGSYVELHFTFTCLQGSLGIPVLDLSSGNEDCIVHISWATSAACPEIETPDLANCRVYDNVTLKFYDLSPLKETSQGATFFQVDAGDGKTQFYVSVCKGMKLHKTDKCYEAGVCMITPDKKHTLIAKYKNWDMTFIRGERIMVIKFCDGSCDKNIITSKITFICDEGGGNGKPELETYGSFGADFVWRTNLVCPPVEAECFYKKGSDSYDLQLLSSRTNSWRYVAEQGKERFWINICRGIRHGPEGCPSTASVCLKTAGSDVVSVLGFTSTQRISKTSDGFLMLRYTGTGPVQNCISGSKPKVVIKFECGSHVGRPLKIDSSLSACSFVFKWKSKVACKLERQTLVETESCTVKNPVTDETVDFSKLLNGTSGTWTIIGKDESNKEVKYAINICGPLDQDISSDCKGKKGVCIGDKFYPLDKKEIYYENFMFSLWLTSPTEKFTVVITFQCSAGELGSPKFEYVSNNFHYVFSWPTSIVCPKDVSSNVTDPPVVRRPVKSSSKNGIGIAFGVVAAVVLVVIIGVVLYKPSRRRSLISCVRLNFKKHILRKEIKYPVYRYEKLNALDDDEADALLREAEGSDEENEDDDDLLAF